jgi:hypothetical protein
VALGTFWFLGFGILGLLIAAMWVVGLVDIFRRSDFDRRTRSAWILIVVLLPLVGTLIYLAKRPTSDAEFQKIAAAQTRRHQ